MTKYFFKVFKIMSFKLNKPLKFIHFEKYPFKFDI